MTEEVELKLNLTDAGPDAILAAGLLPGSPQQASQHAVYFDTPDGVLAAHGLTLRIRKTGDRHVQTVKRTAPGAAGVFARPEWELPVPAMVPVPDPATPLAPVLGGHVARLAPIFAVRTLRRTWVLRQDDGTRIEAVIDQGRISAGDRHSPVCECELELIEGAPAALFALARRLNAVTPVRLGALSKAERGQRLIGPLPLSVKSAPLPLGADVTAAEAFRRIALSCLRQFRLNEDLLLVSRQAEPLHQARVALRRLRPALAVFRPLPGPSAAPIRAELRWLAGALGDARDLDVLLSRAPAGPLADRIRAARERAHDGVAETLDSDRARALILDLAEWINGGAWLADPRSADLRDMPARDFAAAALTRFRRKVKRGGRDLVQLEDEARHDLRKDVKKLRYAVDFLDPLLDGRGGGRRRRFGAALEDLQEQLGLLNDLAAAPQVLDRLGLSDAPGAADLIRPRDRDDLLDAADRALGRLVRAKRYWT